MRVTWAQALAWRMDRHLLAPTGMLPADDVVNRLGAIPAWSGDPGYAVRVRQAESDPGDLERALAQGRLIKVFAFRGATHLMTPAGAAVHLALRAASRMWERRSWRDHYQVEPEEWPSLRRSVREALADGPRTLEELAAAVTTTDRFAHLGPALSATDTFLKPFFWQGDVCFGPTRDGKVTLQALEQNPHWPGVADLAEAGPQAVTAYLSAYGPATPQRVHYWLGEGLGAGRKRITGWLAGLGERVTEVDVEGESALVLTEHVEQLGAAVPTGALRFLTGHDQWVLGPGTAEVRVVPPEHRPTITRGANLVIAGGVVCGTWRTSSDGLAVSWFAGAEGSHPDLAEQSQRVSELLG